MKRIWIGLLVLSGMVKLEAQTISGHVYDQVSGESLPGATVKIKNLESGSATDSDGFYTLTNLEPGRYELQVSFVGYSTVSVPDIWVKTGKITIQDFQLQQTDSNLSEITVSSSRPLIQPGRIAITEEQINRFAATYYDPARLVTSSPDVVVANDQNNRVSVRGISPSYNVWRLEGAEIINPNHLSNAGTFMDTPTPTGGGVNMLSAQMLSSSQFLYSDFGAEYGNSVGGIFDMRLKNGNQQNRQYTAQASLIGFDLETDGPFREGGKMTYSANYRYSFTGLLTNFGVDFGGESIGFQDLALNIATPVGKRSQLKVFGVGGLSYNDFTHKTYAESESEKDRKDIYYNNATGIAGMALKTAWSSSSLNTTIAYSVADNQRDESNYNTNDEVDYQNDYASNQKLLSIHSKYQRKISRIKTQIGVMANHYDYTLEYGSEINQNSWLIRPYIDFNGHYNPKWSWEMGASYLISKEDQLPEWRYKLSWLMNESNLMSLAVGQYGQKLNASNYFFNEPNQQNTFFTDQPIQQSLRYTLAYTHTGKVLTTNVEAFYYQFIDVKFGFPTLYWTGYSVNPENVDAYTGGISASVERNFSKGVYLRTGASLFESLINDQPNPYNTRCNLNLAVGKEWDRSKGEKNKRFSANLRGIYQGPKRLNNYEPVYNGPVLWYRIINPSDLYFSGAYKTTPYVRLDVRLQWTRYRANRTSSIALDLQNVAGIKNEAYRYYDSFLGKEQTQYQLGLIPILAWRVEW